MGTVIFLLIIVIIVGVVYFQHSTRPNSPQTFVGSIPVSEVLSHWSHFFNFLALSSQTFYEQLEKALKEHEMPNSKIERTKHKEAGLLSANRKYLRIRHGDIVFDVCAAPFGKDFFISWWLYETAGTIE